MTGPFIAVDWGTTNRRAWLIGADGAAAASERDGLGILSVPPGGFADEAAGLRARMGGAPMLLAGMVGSNRGWVDAGYVGCPATLDDLAARVARPVEGVAIVPGVSRLGEARADVMRGEEVQLFGAVAAGLAPPDALLCQPGTHCKWAWMARAAIRNFTTAMTGELFALLKGHSLVGQDMTREVADDEVFAAGVAASADTDLLSALFGVRAAGLLGLRPRETAASYVSGLLIGADCHARLRGDPRDVYLLADPPLSTLYARAIGMTGGRAVVVDSQAAFLAGITRLWERLA